MWIIYDINPAPQRSDYKFLGDDYRLVEIFDTEEAAKHVLKALEEVNIDFNLYKIIKQENK